MARKHELWMAEHGRVYKDEAEKARRFQIFKENIKFIEDFNKVGEHGYTLGVNQFADLTTEEFTATYTGGEFREPEPEFEAGSVLRSIKYENPTGSEDTLSLPSSVNWTAKGAVNPVINQGTCGSCWAQTVVATVEGLIKIKKDVLYKLSAQQLIDCDRYNLGCKGGWMTAGYEYVIKNEGLTNATNYPYVGYKGLGDYCERSNARKTVATINGYRTVTGNSEPSLMSAVAQQPVAVGIKSKSKDLQFYKSGIFNGPCGARLDHAVTLVGYGETDDKTKYWLVKNSWGTSWGEGGYIRMIKDVGSREGLCGIARSPSYPTL